MVVAVQKKRIVKRQALRKKLLCTVGFNNLRIEDNRCYPCRMLKKPVQRGRSERRPEAYPLGYVEGLNDARTTLAGFFSILLEG